MIFVASTADFSENRIGTVEIPIPVSENTTKVLSYFSASPTQKVKDALNWFVYNLEQDNLWSKLKYISMPFLASNVKEALTNVQTGEIWVKGDLFEDTAANTGSFTLSNKALKVVAGQPVAYLRFDQTTTDDFTLGAYIHEKGEGSGKNDIIFGQGTSNYFNFMYEKQGANTFNTAKPAVSHDFYEGITDNHFFGGTLHERQSRAYHGASVSNKTFTTANLNIRGIAFGAKDVKTYQDGTTWAYMRQSLALFFFGDGMTAEEFTRLKGYVDNLMKEVYELS